MTVNDIREMLFAEKFKIGDLMDDIADFDAKIVRVRTYTGFSLEDISLMKWAIDEICYRLQYDLWCYLHEDFEPDVLETFDNHVRRRLYYDDHGQKIFVDEITFPSWDCIAYLSNMASLHADFMCNAANKWYKKSEMFNLASSTANTVSEYLLLALGGEYAYDR